jgi:hypothetical protein
MSQEFLKATEPVSKPFKKKVKCPYCSKETDVLFPPSINTSDISGLSGSCIKGKFISTGQKCVHCDEDIAVERTSENYYRVLKANEVDL